MILYFNVITKASLFSAGKKKKPQSSLLFTLIDFYLKECVVLAV